MTARPTISVVLTAHREGLLAAATLKSAARAAAYARRIGHSVETVISLDRADRLTCDVIASWKEPDVRVFECDFGDLGLSRNHCVQAARGEFIATLDADDLFGENWLGDAVTAAMADRREIVWHPEINVVFGEADHVFRHVDMESEEFEILSMVVRNPWSALCFTRRDLLLRVPYPASDLRRGVGYEDWGWNRHVIEIGYIHKIVRGTGHAIRRKAMSLVRQASAAGAFPAETALFRRLLERRAHIGDLRRSLGPTDILAKASKLSGSR